MDDVADCVDVRHVSPFNFDITSTEDFTRPFVVVDATLIDLKRRRVRVSADGDEDGVNFEALLFPVDDKRNVLSSSVKLCDSFHSRLRHQINAIGCKFFDDPFRHLVVHRPQERRPVGQVDLFPEASQESSALYCDVATTKD